MSARSSVVDNLAELDEQEFLQLAEGLGYRPLRNHDGYLLTAVRREHRNRFPGCRRSKYQPDAQTTPKRWRYEIVWWPPPAVDEDEDDDDDGLDDAA